MHNELINIIVAHSNQNLLHVISNIFKHKDSVRITGKANSLAALAAMAVLQPPHIIIADADLDGVMDFEDFRKITKQGIPIKLVVVSKHCPAAHIAAAVKAKCSAFLIADTKPHEYIAAIEKVMQGEKVYSRQATLLLNSLKEGRDAVPLEKLSFKQWIVLRRIYNGYTSPHIAPLAGLSKETVATYKKLIFKKIGTSSPLGIEYYLKTHGEEERAAWKKKEKGEDSS